jgi:phosphate/sulfate permease
MDTLFLFIVIVLFALAISDLIVGVSNDAVNFLNSAVGSKAAPFKVIMVVAALGVFVGATFSTGMMEVARKGIFHPEHFYFSEIMFMFLAVMLTDIILLDTFNTLGLPTSTTVSIVFELLGSAVAISLIKISTDPNALHLYEYINTSKALAIISGILISVVVAFTVGAVVQYLSRLWFSFNYEKTMKYYGSIFGGLAITFITYFILIKGAKDASFMTTATKDWIKEHTWAIVGIGFLAWTIIMQLAVWIFKANILKFIVLVGTFGLAMAFAGNDLVNFIGVPLAGFQSFKEFIANPGADPHSFGMAFLGGKIKTDSYLLVIAGLIMVITLWTSRKARSVIKTSIDLARQDEGEERFGSSLLARSVVRFSGNISSGASAITPPVLKRFVQKRFDSTEYNAKIAQMQEPPSFDLIRASVNLVVASILIAFATSLKLPLSTTYVTFMVAMGTSLADKAWGRDSAVYRVTGVLSVIGGWFLTAIIAFTVSFVMANIIYWGGTAAIIILIALAIFLVLRTHRIYKRRQAEQADDKQEQKVKVISVEHSLINSCSTEVNDVIDRMGDIFCKTINSARVEDRKGLKEQRAESEAISKRAKKLKKRSHEKLRLLEDSRLESGLYYIQVLDYLRETAHSLDYIVSPAFTHFDNNHKPFSEIQQEELAEVCKSIKSFLYHASRIVKDKDFAKMDALFNEQGDILELLKKFNKNQIKRLKKAEDGTRSSMLFITILQETKGLLLNLNNLIKAQRDFLSQK